MQKETIKTYYCSKLEEIGNYLPADRRIVVLIDSSLEEMYGTLFPYPSIGVEAREESKSFLKVEEITLRLMEMGADRGTLLLVVGGGILSDLGGFIASIYFRGIDFAYVPTTLLAQVDASIGGKCAINVSGYKNILGVVKQPCFTLFCGEFLNSLPKKEVEAGLAEMMKTFLLADRSVYFDAVDSLTGTSPFLKRISNISELLPFIKKAAEIKISVVERDPYEKGERKLLNLGHTFAHALEKLCSVSHGEGVSIGIALAAKLSVKLRLLESGEGDKILRDMEQLGLPVKSPVAPRELTEIITKDKKRDGDNIQFVLLKSIGTAVIYPISIDRLKGVLNDLS